MRNKANKKYKRLKNETAKVMQKDEVEVTNSEMALIRTCYEILGKLYLIK